MAQETEFAIGTRASCSDGDCGVLRRIIIHPDARTVTHLVIEPRHGSHPGRLVPVDLVDAADGEIRLRCTVAEFENLDPAEEEELVEGAGLITGLTGGPGVGDPGPVQVVVDDIVPVGEADVRPGDPVHAADGEIGAVQGFLVNPGDNQVTHVLLKEGHLWGRKKVAIPISAVTGTEDGIINLNLTKKQVEDLPPAG